MPGTGQREIEAALVVASSNPEAVFARLQKLGTLGPHRLESCSPQRLRDRYFDTPERDLWRSGLALRARDVEGERLLALKGELGPRERLEIEERENEAAWKRLEGELRARDVDVRVEALGVIQEHDTTRTRRRLVSAGRTAAELALEQVRYRLHGREVRLYEAEVELTDVDADLDPLVVELQRAAPELREWPYNKLATGAAIATALDGGELSLDGWATLPWQALDQLARRLTSGPG